MALFLNGKAGKFQLISLPSCVFSPCHSAIDNDVKVLRFCKVGGFLLAVQRLGMPGDPSRIADLAKVILKPS